MSLDASLHSPYLLNCYEVYERNGCIFAIMEWMPDGDLQQVARNFHTQYSEAFCKYSIWSVVQGLHKMHESSVWHRDIKAENVLICHKNRSLKITDLSLSLFKENRGKNRETRLEMTGTPTHAAPEILQGLQYNEKCDVYSLGCLAYELATGHPPFCYKNPHVTFLLRVLTEEIPPISERFSAEYRDFIS